jgi:FAD/FMN-containing dehydrogenase/Fe-S oxidoreductase
MPDFTEQKRDLLARHLRKHIQGEVRFDATSRRLYSTDASIYQVEPLGVVLPKSVPDIVAIVQIAAEMQVPLTARGGGTSLSGQSIGPGIVMDCSKHLHAILDIDAKARVARVQPGVVLDQFNRALAKENLLFGPEVSTSSRANLGGMIGNNSAGSRSIVYGKTIDHVRRLGVVLADGTPASFGPASEKEWDQRTSLRSLEGMIYSELRRIARSNDAEIRDRFPHILRRVSGYNLDVFCNGNSASAPRGHVVGLHELIVGSEGTLAVITEAEVGLLPRPKFRGLLVPHFSSLGASMDAVAPCLELNPSAVELMDQMLIDLARENLSIKDTMAAVEGRPAALLMVEFSSDDEAEVCDKVDRLRRRLGGVAGVTALVPALDPALRDALWNLRTAGMPLLYGIRGDRKPVTFVEDTAVPPARLPEFVSRFREVLQRNGTDGAFYGHASVGCLHIRPLLNLKDAGEVARMRRIMIEITDLVLEFGGALSGEHGDGMARSEWNRKMFGPVVYEAFCQVKRAFDPKGILNPGKVVQAAPMTENLRFAPGYAPAQPETVFDYSRQEGFVRSIELCNGSGVCRKMQGGTMCPSFRATQDERDSTRGRANALRLALAGKQPLRDLRSRWLYDVFDLCLMCKACKSECPSNVDMAKLKAELLHLYYKGRSRPLGHLLFTQVRRFNRLAASLAPLVNRLQELRPLRWLMEQVAGIDRRRSLPPLHANHLRRWFSRHRRKAPPARLGRVLLLDDCFTTFNEPAIGRAAVRVLERAGYGVELAGLACCGRPMISKGFLTEVRQLVQDQAPSLAGRLEEGTALLGLEPSCLLTLVDEWPELLPSAETRKIAAAADLADVWLAREAKAGRCHLDLHPLEKQVLLHVHCHQKALRGTKGTAAALSLVPNLDVNVLDTGCCGMAGSFGFEKEHYDLSVAVAQLSLLPALASAPAATVAAPGTSCRHQIKDLAGRHALHPMQILEAALDPSGKGHLS